ncbi:hypothetical protein AXX17_AT2G13070 [Arabidopsis thaliana]|uniref:Uncharacterized protein n=1 Tax=Arabidopsis thaliana TaxID=3702 RepID=A0A178VP55_ARATH|nr:hypothetical protein AXX17_AT2G13070 [Arabidopsis thaliana]
MVSSTVGFMSLKSQQNNRNFWDLAIMRGRQLAPSMAAAEVVVATARKKIKE